MKKAQDLLNYTPESNFLKKLKRQSEMAHGEGQHKGRRQVNDNVFDDQGCSGCGCRVSINFSNFNIEIVRKFF